MTAPTTLEAARRWAAAYENHPLTAAGDVTMKFARALLAAEADNARLREVLRNLVKQSNEAAPRTSGMHPSIRQPWLLAIHKAAAALAEAPAGGGNGPVQP